MAWLRPEEKRRGWTSDSPVECEPEETDPLGKSGHLALLSRRPLQADDAEAAQGQEPGQRGLIVVEDFLVVAGGNVQLGVKRNNDLKWEEGRGGNILLIVEFKSFTCFWVF